MPMHPFADMSQARIICPPWYRGQRIFAKGRWPAALPDDRPL